MQLADIIQWVGGGTSSVVSVVLLILMYRSGLLSELLGLNKKDDKKDEGPARAGENLPELSSKQWFDDITEMFTTLETNHVAHLQESLNRMEQNHKEFRETQLKQCGIIQDTRDILKDMQLNGIRLRKN